ncbi:hypothetical protein LTS12_028592 [Elasticomyces elasticus]|nr:hypothetical protein LTS12_028592 [Elasticomyces elasticus]
MAGKDELTKKAKLKKAIQQGHWDITKIYAQNALRKQNEKLSLLRLESRNDSVPRRGMEQAMKSMDLENMSAVMDRFETQFEDLVVATGYYETATSNPIAVATPQEAVDKLMSQVADEAGVELS